MRFVHVRQKLEYFLFSRACSIRELRIEGENQ